MTFIKWLKKLKEHFPIYLVFGATFFIGIIVAIIGKAANTNIATILTGSGVAVTGMLGIYITWVVLQIKTVNYSNPRLSSLPNYYKNIDWKKSVYNFSQIKMIVCDLDGTLLDHNGDISWRTIEMLKQLRKERPDLLFVPATGRGYFTTNNVLGGHVKGKYFICHNGAVLSPIKEFKPLFEKDINSIFVQSLFDFTLTNNIHALVFSSSGESLIHNTCLADNTWFEAWIQQYKFTQEPLDGKTHLYQCGIWVPNKKNKMFCKFIKENLSVEMYFYPHKEFTYYEITGAGVNKQTMIEKVAELENIKESEILTFGNGNNDVKMLSNSSIGVAVGNAERVLLQTADIIIDPNYEDGVARFITKYFLNKNLKTD